MSLAKIFKRKRGQDEIDEMSYSRVGISLAASWSWGLSMVLTIAFMNTMGIIPALVWVIGNILAIPLFGYARAKLPQVKKWITFLPFNLFTLFIVVIAIIMNQQALLIGLGGGRDIASYQFLAEQYSLPLIIIISIIILLFIYRYGLRGSVLTDLGQYAVQIVMVGCLTIISLLNNFSINEELEIVTSKGIEWVFPLGFLGIISGTFTDPMIWQRFDCKEDQIKLGLWGGFWFALYMILVIIVGLFFKPAFLLSLLLLIIIIAVATSTLDSAFSSVQYCTERLGVGKTPGLVLAFMAIITWPYLMDLGISEIWGIYAGYRWKLVVTMLIATFLGSYFLGPKNKNKISNWLKRNKLYTEKNGL